VLFIVHGGGWARGHKSHRGLIENKATYWLPQGYVLVSTNYRLLPGAGPKEQAQDVADAVAEAQRRAKDWKADAERFVLIGHSAGAHLVSLLATRPELLASAKAVPPVGVISLDSAAMDVVRIMESPRHPKLYDRAFGKERAYWIETSPYHALSREVLPMLAVCSTRIAASCAQARSFADKAKSLGARVEVLPQNLSHMEVNRRLGESSLYTEAVAAFIRTLVGVPNTPTASVGPVRSACTAPGAVNASTLTELLPSPFTPAQYKDEGALRLHRSTIRTIHRRQAACHSQACPAR
jgi:acetyl esterase/lipase